MRPIQPRYIAVALTAGFIGGLSDARADDRFCDMSDPGRPCVVADGTYHARVPAEPRKWSLRRRMPMVVVLHDKGADPASLINDPALVEGIVGRGFALVIPAGLSRSFADGDARGWYVRNTNTVSARVLSRSEANRLGRTSGEDYEDYRNALVRGKVEEVAFGRDELAFLRQVIGHAADEFHLERRATAIIGIAHGASLAWDAACAAPELASLFAPVNGGFIDGYPENCSGSARVLYSHSKAYRAWPLDGAARVNFLRGVPSEDNRGRRILVRNPWSFERADLMPVAGALDHFASSHGCTAGEPEPGAGGVVRVGWDRCAISDSALDYRLYDGDFAYTEDWFAEVLAWPAEARRPARVAPTAPRFLRPPSDAAPGAATGGAVFLRPKPPAR